MTAPREPVSFIIPAYNCAGTIRQAVRSILDGNFEAGDEIVLVDDCSTDSTPRVLKEIQETAASTRIVRHNENKATAAAGRNTGIEQAKHDLLFCLDSDNLLAGQSVTRLCQHMRDAKADAAAFGEMHFFRRHPEEVTHQWVFRESVSLADALSGAVWPGSSGNYLFTRESWVRAGRYHEPYLENRTVDSWIFGIRQLGTGSKMVTLPGAWYFHRYGHKSHWVRNAPRGNQSLAAFVGLIPFLDKLVEEDIEYLFGRDGRYTWYEQLHEHPIRLKAGQAGTDGEIRYLAGYGAGSGLPDLKGLVKKLGARKAGRRK